MIKNSQVIQLDLATNQAHRSPLINVIRASFGERGRVHFLRTQQQHPNYNHSESVRFYSSAITENIEETIYYLNNLILDKYDSKAIKNKSKL